MKEEEKILLIHKILTGEATQDEKNTYRNWLKENEDNLRLDAEIKAVWGKSKDIIKDEINL